MSSKFKGTKRTLNLQWKRSKVVEMSYKGKFTRTEIRDHVQQLSNKLKDKGFDGRIETALQFPIGWRSGYFTDVGDNISLYHYSDSDIVMDDPDTFEEFRVYTVRNPTRGGGTDLNNDCFFNSLQLALNSKNPFKSPEQLKELLKLDRKALVPVSSIPIVDQYLKKYKINVRGDYLYVSPKESIKQEINIILENGHYKLQPAKSLLIKNVNYSEKRSIVWRIDSNDDILTYDGDHERRMTYDEWRKDKSDYKSPNLYIQCETKEELKDYYDNFIADAKALRALTNGVINLFKTGDNYTTALNLFDKFTKTITAEPIEQEEAEFLQKASFASMIWATEYQGPAFKYDVRSQYPSIMKRQQFCLPIKRGEIKFISQDDFNKTKVLSYGIYRATVDCQDKRVFRVNKLGYYTHIDINYARKVGLQVTMNAEGPNALVYSRDKLINADKLFGEFVNTVYPLKEKGIKRAKGILNILWGALCETRIRKAKESEAQQCIIKDNELIRSIKPVTNTKNIVSLYKPQKMYVYDFARIGPFIIAKGRENINSLIYPFLDKVKRVHTDGFIMTEALPTEMLGGGIGDLKLEEASQSCTIKNVMSVTGFKK